MHLKEEEKIQQAIGRLRKRYPRVARHYAIEYDTAEKKARAWKLDGSYVLKTDRQDLTADEIWRAYILLTRVEDAFRNMKSPLLERPIFHHLKNRTQTHIFLWCSPTICWRPSSTVFCRPESTPPGGPCANTSAPPGGHGRAARSPKRPRAENP